MDYNYSVRHEAWLVFKNAEDYWVQRFCKKGFGHVLLITRDQYNWMYLDPHQLKLTYGISPFAAQQDVPRMLRNEGHTVLHVTMFDRATHKKLRYGHLCTCVTFIKYALGVSVRSLTPYGLFKKLLTLSEKDKFKNGIISVRQVI